MRSKDEINALFAQAQEDRRALLAEIEALTPDAQRERLEREPPLVRAFWIRWSAPLHQDVYSDVARDEALDKQIIRIGAAASEAAKRYYGYQGAPPLRSQDAWTEAINDLLSALPDVPATITTHEFDRALHAYR